ncbi:MAG TPA: hypothetical protein PLT66_06560 [Bacillota bacterium]|nr:hypothetical protein [Bacillota bacterium]
MDRKKYKTLLWAIFAVVLCLSALRCILIFKYLDTTGDYTDYSRLALTDNMFTNTFPYVVVALVVIFAAGVFIIKKNSVNSLVYDDTPTIFFSTLTGFMTVTTAGLLVFYHFSGASAMTTAEWAVVVLLVLSCCFFIYAPSKKAKTQSSLFSAMAAMPIIMSIARLLIYFFRINNRPNSDMSLFHLFSLAAIMLFFVYEGKFSVSSGSARLYVFFGLCSVLLTSVYALPELILSSFWIVAWQSDTVFSALELLMSLFIAARLLSLHVDEQRELPEKVKG